MLSCSKLPCMPLKQLLCRCLLQDTKLAILMELCQYGSFFKLIRMARQIKNMKESERIQVGPTLVGRGTQLIFSSRNPCEGVGAAVQQPECATLLGLFPGQPSSKPVGLSTGAQCMTRTICSTGGNRVVSSAQSAYRCLVLYDGHLLVLHQNRNVTA